MSPVEETPTPTSSPIVVTIYADGHPVSVRPLMVQSVLASDDAADQAESPTPITVVFRSGVELNCQVDAPALAQLRRDWCGGVAAGTYAVTTAVKGLHRVFLRFADVLYIG